jgi:hypothetical protein
MGLLFSFIKHKSNENNNEKFTNHSNKRMSPTSQAPSTSIDDTVPSSSSSSSDEFKGIEVVMVETTKNATVEEQPQFAIKINCLDLFKSIRSWMNEFGVMKTLLEWAHQIDWKHQVWKPLKVWAAQTDWKKLRKETKEALDDVDWKDVRKQVREGLEEVDWKKTRQEVSDELKDVDWKQVRKQVKQGLEHVNWKEVNAEIDEVVDWKEVKKSATDIIDSREVKKHFNEMCPEEMQKEMVGDVDWKEVLQSARELSPDDVDCEEVWNLTSDLYQGDEGGDEGGDSSPMEERH